MHATFGKVVLIASKAVQRKGVPLAHSNLPKHTLHHNPMDVREREGIHLKSRREVRAFGAARLGASFPSVRGGEERNGAIFPNEDCWPLGGFVPKV